VRLARQAMTSADHAHDFEALDRSGRRLHGLKASRGSQSTAHSWTKHRLRTCIVLSSSRCSSL
jgi:hypothetical protein